MSAQGIPLKSDFRERARVNDIPVARLIGFEAKEIAYGRATVMLAARPQHANPMGTLHGGILCDIADAAMGMAFASTLAPECWPEPRSVVPTNYFVLDATERSRPPSDRRVESYAAKEWAHASGSAQIENV